MQCWLFTGDEPTACRAFPLEKGGPEKAKQLPDFVSGYNRTHRSEWGEGGGVIEGTDVHPHPLVLPLLHTLAWKCPVSWLGEDAHRCLGQRVCSTWDINTRLLFHRSQPSIVFYDAEVFFCRQLWLIAQSKNNTIFITLIFCFSSDFLI